MKRPNSWFPAAAVLLAGIVLFTGCIPGPKPPYLIDQNTLEYNTPQIGKVVPFKETIRLERFGVAQAYNSTAMVYKPSPYKMAVYQGDRWRVNPGDLVTDFLLRDVRQAGLFQGVFSYRDGENTRYVLEGGIEEFLEIDEQASGKAVVSLTITLLDTQSKEVTKRIIFQKQYKADEPLSEQSASALARGISKVMGDLSALILKDIYLALQTQGK
jgi:ABC-type uncharacterized transport system auxiliary subunit